MSLFDIAFTSNTTELTMRTALFRNTRCFQPSPEEDAFSATQCITVVIE